MKKIGIDARLIDQTGVGTYIQNLLIELEKIPVSNIEFYVYMTGSGKKRWSSKRPHFHVRSSNIRWHSLREQFQFLSQLYSDNLDLVHFTYFSHPILYTRPFVITIHDLIPLYFPTGEASTLIPPIYWLKKQAARLTFAQAVQMSRGIFTPTHAVKEQIIQKYGKQFGDKITVTHEGTSVTLTLADETSSLKTKYSKPFIFRLGNFYPHKNVGKLIEAFENITEDVDLILVGPQDFFSSKVKDQVQASAKKDRIHFHLNPSIDDIVFFYKHAKALIQPSLDEGFGLPLLEASYFGCPALASDIPVFHELLGDSFYSFDPNDTQSIAMAISNRLTDPAPKKAYYNSKEFSFEKMTRETMAVYRSLISQ